MARKRSKASREPNGRISRAKNPTASAREIPADEEPLKLRAKVFGLTPKDAKDQKAGSFIGRLCIRHRNDKNDPIGLTDEQYEAGLRYLELRNLYHRQIGSEDAIYERSTFGTMTDSPEEQAKRWQSIKTRWNEAIASVQRRQNESAGNLFAALDYCVVRDQSFTSMVGDLRIALNGLAEFFSRGKARKAA